LAEEKKMIEGSCHCGKIRLRLDADPTEAIECNCSHCHRKALVLSFVPRDQLTVEAADQDVATYTFNKHVIQHRFCRTCGCQPYAEAPGKDGPTAAVNLRCFDLDLAALTIKPFNGRDL
jgi:hypothetical protein